MTTNSGGSPNRLSNDRSRATANDPWTAAPVHYVADRNEAIWREVLTITEPEVLQAGGFDVIRTDPHHPLHEIYDDVASLQRQCETIVTHATSDLADAAFSHDPQAGVRLTLEGEQVIRQHVKAVCEPAPITHHLDDPDYRHDNPDELAPHHPHQLNPSTYLSTTAQALRMAVLEEIAPDIAAAGGFPAVQRNPNHRRHNSPGGLQRARRQYDTILQRLEPRLTPADFVHTDPAGWRVHPEKLAQVEQSAAQVRGEQRFLDKIGTSRSPAQPRSNDYQREL